MLYIAFILYSPEGRAGTGQTLLERLNFLLPCNKSDVSHKLNLVFLTLNLLAPTTVGARINP